MIGKAEYWVRAAVGMVFAVAAILCLFKGSVAPETIAFVAATQALLGKRARSRSLLSQR